MLLTNQKNYYEIYINTEGNHLHFEKVVNETTFLNENKV
jgi:hypothetical protein